MLGDRHRSHARTAPAVGDAEGLVQVQMRDVTAELAGLRQAQQGVEIGPVDVDLPAVFMDQVAHVADVLLVDAVRRRVGDHDRRQIAGMLLALGSEVLEVDRAVVEGGHHHDPHTGHDR